MATDNGTKIIFEKKIGKIWTCGQKIGLAVMTELGRNIHTYLNKGIAGINLTFFWSMVTSSFKLLGARLENILFIEQKKLNSSKFRVLHAQLFLVQASNSLVDII